jgi:predicted transcriptional regulator
MEFVDPNISQNEGETIDKLVEEPNINQKDQAKKIKSKFVISDEQNEKNKWIFI